MLINMSIMCPIVCCKGVFGVKSRKGSVLTLTSQYCLKYADILIQCQMSHGKNK